MTIAIKPSLKQTVAERVYDIIFERITSGVFGANEHLTEARLTQEIGVGRGAVREVMNKLAADGLVELVPNKGAVVRPLTRKDMADFFQLRGLFEAFAAKRAAERIDEPGSREVVFSLLDEINRLDENPFLMPYGEHDARFHADIMDLAANDIMSSEWRRLRRSKTRIAFLHTLTEDKIRVSLAQHREIALAVLAGEADKAEELSAQHVKLTASRMQRIPNAEFEQLFQTSKKAR